MCNNSIIADTQSGYRQPIMEILSVPNNYTVCVICISREVIAALSLPLWQKLAYSDGIGSSDAHVADNQLGKHLILRHRLYKNEARVKSVYRSSLSQFRDFKLTPPRSSIAATCAVSVAAL